MLVVEVLEGYWSIDFTFGKDGDRFLGQEKDLVNQALFYVCFSLAIHIYPINDKGFI